MTTFSLDQQFSPTAAAIADATIRVIATRGLDAVSVRAVAKESGYAPGSVQYHAPSKDALLAHAFIRSIQRQRSRLAAIEPCADPLESWVAKMTELLPVGGARTEDAAIWVTYGTASATRDWLADLYGQALIGFQSGVADSLRASNGDGPGVPEGSYERTARLVTALVNGLTMDNLMGSKAQITQMVADLRVGLAIVLAPFLPR